MKKKQHNPFVIYGYRGKEFFCDRREETKKIISAIKNNRNLTLYSVRRIGKTGLIYHVFETIRSRNTICIYIDILSTQNLNSFIKRFSDAVIRAIEKVNKNIFKDFISSVKSIRPKLTFDELTGQPEIEFDIENEKAAYHTLDQIFVYLNDVAKKYKIVIAIDEFQQITNYPEKGTEALLRSEVQNAPEISFLFSGSLKHLIISMFNNASRPFYQSTDSLYLDKISSSDYEIFIQKHFNEGDIKIEKELIENILSFARSHTFYVQQICNHLYESAAGAVTKENLNKTLYELMESRQNEFLYYKNLLSGQQWNMLTAIAKEGEVSQPTAKDFLNKYNLSASTAKQSIESLSEKDMIYKDKNVYLVTDVFLSRWLERLE